MTDRSNEGRSRARAPILRSREADAPLATPRRRYDLRVRTLKRGHRAYRWNMRQHFMIAVVTAVAAFSIPGTSLAETKSGTNGPDELIGTAQQDELRGKGGKDTLRGRGEDDLLYGGHGADDVFGGSGRDSVWSGSGADWVRASRGRDEIRTQADRDTLQLGTSGPTRAWTGGGRTP